MKLQKFTIETKSYDLLSDEKPSRSNVAGKTVMFLMRFSQTKLVGVICLVFNSFFVAD